MAIFSAAQPSSAIDCAVDGRARHASRDAVSHFASCGISARFRDDDASRAAIFHTTRTCRFLR